MERLDRKLVIIQLTGGNDGLNTVIPFENDLYYNLRPRLSIRKKQSLAIDNYHGVNKNLPIFHSLFNEGRLNILNNVGYPNATRSHFKSLDIWHSAMPYKASHKSGWVGRYLDQQQHNFEHELGAIEIAMVSSLLMQGINSKGVAIEDIKALQKKLQKNILHSFGQQTVKIPRTKSENLKHIYKVLSQGQSGINKIQQQLHQIKPRTRFRKQGLSKDLKMVSDLIISGAETQIFNVSLGSFDTHIRQNKRHNKLLSELNLALTSFDHAMKKYDKWKDVCILIFSEFGRRVKENASLGTDHGSANNAFIIGEHLQQAGIYNSLHNLKRLKDGDIPYEIDFRQIYASILEDWLMVDSTQILGGAHQKLPIFQSASFFC